MAEQASLSIRGANETACLYNCAHDVFSMLLCEKVVWTGRWADVGVVRSSDHRHCIIRPRSMASEESDAALLTFFVGMRILDWRAFEERKLELERKLDEIRGRERAQLVRTLQRLEALTAPAESSAEAADAQQPTPHQHSSQVDAFVSAHDASALRQRAPPPSPPPRRQEHRAAASHAKGMLLTDKLQPLLTAEPTDRAVIPARLPSADVAKAVARHSLGALRDKEGGRPSRKSAGAGALLLAGAFYPNDALSSSNYSSSLRPATETVLRRTRSDLAWPGKASHTSVDRLLSMPRGIRAAVPGQPTDSDATIKVSTQSLLAPAFQKQMLASAGGAASCGEEAEEPGSRISSGMVASFKRRLLTSAKLAEHVTQPQGHPARSEDRVTDSRTAAADVFGPHQLSLTRSRLLLQPTIPGGARSSRVRRELASEPEQRAPQHELGSRPRELHPLATHRSLPHLRRQQPRDA